MYVVKVTEPYAGPGQIRVAVRAAEVNPVDWKVRSGVLQQVMPISLPPTGTSTPASPRSELWLNGA